MRRLRPAFPAAPILALLFQLDAFLRPQGRRVIALTVDHGLRPESRDEAEYVAKLAAERQIEHHILTWEGEKPEKGIEEAARTARYGLLCGWRWRIICWIRRKPFLCVCSGAAVSTACAAWRRSAKKTASG